MKEHLQPWYDKWLDEHKDTRLIYAIPSDPRLYQVHFVRNQLAGLFWADVPYGKREQAPPPRDDCKIDVYVIGEHTSKSVRLPVYSLERPDIGLQIVLRHNYYNWNVSVLSETPINTDVIRGFKLDYSDDDRERFPNGYILGECWDNCFFEGFPEEVQFGPHSENPCKFSVNIDSEYMVYTFLWLLMRDRIG
ncbi:hypothetical protein LCGC14_0319960 [marine sediment metagenome]|uniref:Uncharacterized protein n=1 Tax=marine sediment metagenome TaxID=412755 RepID=A0A0F9WRK5_9ZZZZ